jgi:hypothetical protein
MPRNSNVRPLKEPVMDSFVQASVDQAGGVFDPATGWYANVHYTGCADESRAKEIVQGLHRAARRIGVSIAAKAHKPDSIHPDGWYVEYWAVDKAMARKYVLEKYGKDRSKWPYSPIKGDRNFG